MYCPLKNSDTAEQDPWFAGIVNDLAYQAVAVSHDIVSPAIRQSGWIVSHPQSLFCLGSECDIWCGFDWNKAAIVWKQLLSACSQLFWFHDDPTFVLTDSEMVSSDTEWECRRYHLLAAFDCRHWPVHANCKMRDWLCYVGLSIGSCICDYLYCLLALLLVTHTRKHDPSQVVEFVLNVMIV